MTIADYIIKFEQLHFKVKSFKMEILHAVLSYKLFTSANLSRKHKHMAKASVSKINYNIIKYQPGKVFTNNAIYFQRTT